MYEGGHILKRVVYDLLRIEYNISRKKDFEKKRWNLANKDCSKWEGKNCNCNYSFFVDLIFLTCMLLRISWMLTSKPFMAK